MSECRGPDCTHPDCDGGRADTVPLDELRRQLVDELHDPVVKYDGNGQPVRASQMGNRAQRRARAKEARRWRR